MIILAYKYIYKHTRLLYYLILFIPIMRLVLIYDYFKQKLSKHIFDYLQSIKECCILFSIKLFYGYVE